jgi:phosphoribosylformylglycinamidine synthase
LEGTEEVAYPQQDDFTEIICPILSAANVASREDIIRTYDHEVKGNTVIKPLQGDRAGPNDAAVLKPLDNYWKGIVISCGMNPLYGKIDPYWMAASAIDEAVRNNVAVGGRRIALLDNFTWGNPEKQEQLDSLVSACMACYETGKAFGTPFISGKDSLYNESPLGPVTPTLLITGLGLIPDIRKAITLDFKTPDNPVYIIGRTYPELGGSHFCLVQNILGRFVPQVRFNEAHMIMSSVTKVIDSGFVRACHDLSEGGLAVAAAEMSFTGGLGFEMDLRNIPHGRGSWRNDIALFSESNSRFLIEVNRDDEDSFVKYLERVPYAKIGTVSHKSIFSIKGLEGNVICTTELEKLYDAWHRGVESW